MSIKDLKQGDIVYFANYIGICYFPSAKIVCKEGYMPISGFSDNFRWGPDNYYSIARIYRTLESIDFTQFRINETHLNLSKNDLKKFQYIHHYYQIFPIANFIKL